MGASNEKNDLSQLQWVAFFTFLILKLSGAVNWSWWWVTSPLWISLAVVGVVLTIGVILVSVFHLFQKMTKTHWQWIGAVAFCALLGILAALA